MNRTLEEILNTPVEFEEGMRVFSLGDYRFGKITHIRHESDYPVRTLREDSSGGLSYTIEGKYHKDRAYRELLTEQEAYELFPSLKPRVYEYQVVFKSGDIYDLSGAYYSSQSEFKANAPTVMAELEFVELYQPSKRERKS